MENATKNEEEWRWVIGFEGMYKVSDLGRVRSVDRCVPMLNQGKNPMIKFFAGVMLKTSLQEGYPSLTLYDYKTKSRKKIAVHTIVARAFLGKVPPNCEVRHLDGNRENPRLKNLAYGTHKQNAEDMVRHGRAGLVKGEDMHSAVLTEKNVLFIRRIYPKMTPTELAKMFNCHAQTIWQVIYRNTWKHVK